jgi:hypothetical protein
MNEQSASVPFYVRFGGIAKQLRHLIRGTSGTAIFPLSGKSYADLSGALP